MVSEVSGFDPVIDMIDTKLNFIPLAKLAQYKSIIWDVYGDNATGTRGRLPLLYSYIQHRPKNPDNAVATGVKATPDVLALAMAAGSHIMICGREPIQLVNSRLYTRNVRFPIIFLYELEGKQDGAPNQDVPVGDLSFAYRELCLETLDLCVVTSQKIRNLQTLYCLNESVRPHGDPTTGQREDTMREARSKDPNFPTVSLRIEAAGPGKWYDPAGGQGLGAEIYNPEYFRSGSGSPASCQYVPAVPRSCFQPIYGLGCNDTLEPTYDQPIAFWTSAYANHVADVPGAVGARSVVFGFEPAFIAPSEFRPGMDYILFNEWKLPRHANMTATGSP
jgi:hypothetical protein